MDMQQLLQMLQSGGQQQQAQQEPAPYTWGQDTTDRIQAYSQSPGDYESFRKYVMPAFNVGARASAPRMPEPTQSQAPRQQQTTLPPQAQTQEQSPGSQLDYNAISQAPDWSTLYKLMMQGRQ